MLIGGSINTTVYNCQTSSNHNALEKEKWLRMVSISQSYSVELSGMVPEHKKVISGEGKGNGKEGKLLPFLSRFVCCQELLT